MIITSAGYAAFVLVTVLIYYLLPRHRQNAWLLLASFAFILTWAWQFALVLFGLTLLNFFLAQKLTVDRARRRIWLWLGITLDIAVLVHYKSVDFYLPQLQRWLDWVGVTTETPVLQVIMPLGVSYYAHSGESDQLFRAMPITCSGMAIA